MGKVIPFTRSATPTFRRRHASEIKPKPQPTSGVAITHGVDQVGLIIATPDGSEIEIWFTAGEAGVLAEEISEAALDAAATTGAV